MAVAGPTNHLWDTASSFSCWDPEPGKNLEALTLDYDEDEEKEEEERLT